MKLDLKVVPLSAGYNIRCCTSLIELRDTVNKTLESIPEEYRGNTYIEYDFDYSDDGVSIDVGYRRPFTPEEQEALQNRFDECKRIHEENEKKQLEFLLNKYKQHLST